MLRNLQRPWIYLKAHFAPTVPTHAHYCLHALKVNGLVNALTCLGMLFSATEILPSLSNQSMFSTATAPHCEDANVLEIGQCEFNCDKHFKSFNYIDLVYREMPVNVSEWNEFMCGEFHRAGTLCGECDQKKNFFPQAYSLLYLHIL